MLGYSSKEYTPSQWGRHGGRMATGSQDVGGTEVASSSVKAVCLKRAPQPLTESMGGHFTFEPQQGGSSRVRCLGPITRSLSCPEASLTVQKKCQDSIWAAILFTSGKHSRMEREDNWKISSLCTRAPVSPVASGYYFNMSSQPLGLPDESIEK